MRNVRAAVIAAAISLCLADCSPANHSTTANAQATPQQMNAAPRPVVKKPRVLAMTPAPLPSPEVTVSPSPSPATLQVAAAVKPAARAVPLLPPNASPRILDVSVSETTVHSGDTVSGSVLTSSNVASVQARIGGYAVNLSKTGVGRFALSYTVAPLPWFVHGNFTMRVIARNTRGQSVECLIPLTVR